LPSAVHGPVDLAAFLRFASILRYEIMLVLRGVLCPSELVSGADEAGLLFSLHQLIWNLPLKVAWTVPITRSATFPTHVLENRRSERAYEVYILTTSWPLMADIVAVVAA
jgi:hypothetical protein